MLRVCGALLPIVAASVYLFGWRSLVLLAVVLVCGLASEAAFTWSQGKPITSAVLVTCLIFHLSLPPTTPLWMAAIGITAGVVFGKMIFGGFGRNVFNPAMVGRCFIYVNFPYELTGRWVEPFWGGAGGLLHWAPGVDAVTRATPLSKLAGGAAVAWQDLLLGNVSGSLGETSAVLILLGGAYIIYRKAASWRLALSCVLGGALVGSAMYMVAPGSHPPPGSLLLAGSFLFGTMFVVTEPISGPKVPLSQWIYGFLIGGLTMVLRGYSNFSEGVMFSVLIMNAFVPLLDQALGRAPKASKEAS